MGSGLELVGNLGSSRVSCPTVSARRGHLWARVSLGAAMQEQQIEGKISNHQISPSRAGKKTQKRGVEDLATPNIQRGKLRQGMIVGAFKGPRGLCHSSDLLSPAALTGHRLHDLTPSQIKDNQQSQPIGSREARMTRSSLALQHWVPPRSESSTGPSPRTVKGASTRQGD